jgi:hypothetical protein
MPLLIFQSVRATHVQFVEFWSARYKDTQEDLYMINVGQELTTERILSLYQWKNGTPLSERKQASVLRNFVDRREELSQHQPDASARAFLDHFANGGAIWRIFWLHCWAPDRFPIYDQHVHRAMTFITNGVCEEIPQYDARKVDAYIESYLPFHAKFDGMNGRDVDKALWTFGKFLKFAEVPQISKVSL